MKLLEAITKGANILKKNKIPSFFLDSEILIGKILDKKREFIILNQNLEIKKNDYLKYISLIQKRSTHTPLAYLIKSKDFWKSEFYVDNRVLIPRPDTEIIIEEVLSIVRAKKIYNFLEIGVGSGCIVLSILNEIKHLKAVGIDISQKALEVCKINSKRLCLNSRLKLYKSDIDKFDIGKYDLIVSNPPYICRSDLNNLMKDVVDYEPKYALNGGNDGAIEIRKVVKKSSKLLKKGGKLVLEIGHNQKTKVCEILKNNEFYIQKVIKDLRKQNRCIVSIKI
ncbi:peptide chain release factor N(5)-glutamine methyltransferase [Candidatus Pelagibacter sp.]|uniref:peptide chain release factor N(5)-glutamine methyltransferase n=1 Tax=Candidatus Pelagibacter sp. TaxID=2024849 RepID=UPI003F83C1F4